MPFASFLQLRATGLRGPLTCDGGSIDGPLYSFLSASGDITVSSRKAAACANYDNLYNAVNTQFSNPQQKEFLTLAKTLIDSLYAERKTECGGVI